MLLCWRFRSQARHSVVDETIRFVCLCVCLCVCVGYRHSTNVVLFFFRVFLSSFFGRRSTLMCGFVDNCPLAEKSSRNVCIRIVWMSSPFDKSISTRILITHFRDGPHTIDRVYRQIISKAMRSLKRLQSTSSSSSSSFSLRFFSLFFPLFDSIRRINASISAFDIQNCWWNVIRQVFAEFFVLLLPFIFCYSLCCHRVQRLLSIDSIRAHDRWMNKTNLSKIDFEMGSGI